MADPAQAGAVASGFKVRCPWLVLTGSAPFAKSAPSPSSEVQVDQFQLEVANGGPGGAPCGGRPGRRGLELKPTEAVSPHFPRDSAGIMIGKRD